MDKTEEKKQWGGYRPNGGRPQSERKTSLNVRISQEAADKLTRLTNNKSEYIDKMILSIQE